MLQFIKTFYLWLALFTLCNVVSIFTALTRHSLDAANLLLLPVAWLCQTPLVLSISLIHHGINKASRPLPGRWKKSVRFILCALCAFIMMGMYTASQIMYQQIETFISWDAYRAGLSNAAQILPDVLGEIGGELLLIGAGAIVFSFIHTRRYYNQARAHCPKVFALLSLVFLTSGAGSFALVYNRTGTTIDRIRQDLLPTTYLTFSLIDTLLPSASPSVDFLADWVLDPVISLEEFVPARSLKNRPHVFFIMLESVSSDRYGFAEYSRKGITPNLDALAEDSLIYPRTYAAANHSNYSQTSTHASQYPLRRKQLDQFEEVNYPKTMLFDILGHGGYQTAFFSAQNEDWQGMKTFIHSDTELQHFYHSKNELGNNIGIESKVDDELVLQRALEYLDARTMEQPLFMYLNFQATHFPYEIPEEAARPYQPCSTEGFDFNYTCYDEAQLNHVINKYDNALHYVDQQVGRLVDFLKEEGIYKDSLIVVASDHGEAFYAHGLPTHGTALFEDQIRTAALFKLPGSTRTGIRNHAISLIDINPTVLEILGLENHPNFQGQQILDVPRSEPIYLVSHSLVKSHGIVDYPWKYFTSERDGERLSNLESDPNERRDFSTEQPEQMNRLKKKLQLYQQKQLYYYTVLPQQDRNEFYPPQH